MLARSEDAYRAVRRGHRRGTTVRLWHPSSGFVGILPISAGALDQSLSKADGVRSGRVTVPGYEWWQALTVPGAWVEVEASIEGETWDLGQHPIVRVEATRPRGDIEVSLGDWAIRRSQPMAEANVTIGSTSRAVASVVSEQMHAVMPGTIFAITRDDSGGALCTSGIEVRIGGNVWSALTDLANQVGCVVVVTSRSTGEIRRFAPGAAVDDLDGCIVSETTAIVADEAVNRVIVQAEQSNPEGAGSTVFRAERTLTTGPYAYSRDGIGLLALVDTSIRQPVVTQAVVDAEGDRIFSRRAGIVRSQQAVVVPMPWLQAGDNVGWTSVVEGRLTGLIDSLSYPLTAQGTMRLTMRDSVLAGDS